MPYWLTQKYGNSTETYDALNVELDVNRGGNF